tara:strand:+ start:568 stop:2280 length:1713 start_codon:yes stop_codon:yes gene_type:complete
MEYFLKASAIIVIFYVSYKALLQRDTFFESNRYFLLFGLLTAIIIPFIVIPIYVEQPPVSLGNLVIVDPNTAPEVNNGTFDLVSFLTALYLIGVIILTFRFFLQLRALVPLLSTNQQHKSGRYTIVKTTNNITPFSFFNYIVYNPEQFNNTELEQIITHEKVHVSQHHSLDVLLGQLACIIFWFNPFIWLYNKDLKQNLEFIADNKAIHFSNCKKSYQYTLLKTSMPKHQLALTNNFYNSLIKKRIVMLHKSKSKKINLLKFALIIPALALFLMSFNTEKVYLGKANSEPQNSIVKTLKASSIEVLISKDFSDSDFEKLKVKFKNEGLTLKIQGVKRNKQGDITAIKIEVISKSSNANFSIDTDGPINPIKIAVDDDGKNILIINGQAKKMKKMGFVPEDGIKHEIDQSGPEKNVFVFKYDNDTISKEEVIIKNGDTIHLLKIHNGKTMKIDTDEDVIFISKDGNDKKLHKLKLITIKEDGNEDNLIWTSDENKKTIINSKGDKDVIKIVAKDGNDPLFLVDGEEITKQEMNDISPETIDKVEVLKGESATKKYGDKGKNGVVIITTKKN